MLDGPIPVMRRDETGALTDTPAEGAHYNIDRARYDANAELLAPYHVEPSSLQRVYAGDDPNAAQWTIALRFPDQKTADQVIASLG